MVSGVTDMILPTRLARFVRRVRAVTASDPDGETYRRLPDGECEVLVSFDGSAVAATLIGTRTFALEKRATRPTRVLLLRFRAGGGYPFFGRRMSELTDRMVPLDELWNERTCDAMRGLADATTAAARAIDILERVLAGSTVAEPASILGIRRILATLAAAPRLPTASELAAQVGASERQLRRAFAEVVGMSPKQFLRVARFQRALALTNRCRVPPPWSEIAEQAGYFDQAHLIGEFRAMTGLTPGAWSASRRVVRSKGA
jgi:AraC-like DNA-binding protein